MHYSGGPGPRRINVDFDLDNVAPVGMDVPSSQPANNTDTGMAVPASFSEDQQRIAMGGGVHNPRGVSQVPLRYAQNLQSCSVAHGLMGSRRDFFLYSNSPP